MLIERHEKRRMRYGGFVLTGFRTSMIIFLLM